MIFWGKKKKIERLHNEAVAKFENGEYEESVKRFAKLCDLEPTSERLYYLGVLFDLMGLHEESAKALQSSVEMDASNSRAWYSLSMVHDQMEDFDAAYNAIEKAHQQDPDDYRILNLFAQLCLTSENHKDPQRAIQLARRACELTNNQDEVCLATLQDAEEAVA